MSIAFDLEEHFQVFGSLDLYAFCPFWLEDPFDAKKQTKNVEAHIFFQKFVLVLLSKKWMFNRLVTVMEFHGELGGINFVFASL